MEIYIETKFNNYLKFMAGLVNNGIVYHGEV